MASIDFSSQSSCFAAYKNYFVDGNSWGITQLEIGRICYEYEDSLAGWRAILNIEKDENNYTIIDDESFVSLGRENAEKNIGFDGDVTGQTVSSRIGVVASGSAALTSAGVLHSGANLVGKIASKAGKEAAKETMKTTVIVTEKVTETATEKVTETVTETVAKEAEQTAVTETTTKAADIIAYVAAGIAIAMAAKYLIEKPKYEQAVNACNAATGEINNRNDIVIQSGDQIDQIEAEIEQKEAEAEETTNEANNYMAAEIADQTVYADMAAEYADAINNKTGTKADLDALEELQGKMDGTKSNIQSISDECTNTVAEKYSDIEGMTEYYQDILDNINETQGTIDFVSGFDNATRLNCLCEGFGQAANALTGAEAGLKLLATGWTPGTWWQLALGAASIAAGVTSGIGAAKLFGYANQAADTVTVREATDKTNLALNDCLENSITVQQDALDNVDSLEKYVPDEVPTPTVNEDDLPEQNEKKNENN